MVSSRLTSIAAAALVTLFCAAGPAAAMDWFVSPSGQIGNAGTEDSPWDIASALTGHGGQVQPGDTIYLLQGTYVVPRTLDYTAYPVVMRGTAAQPIVVRPAAGARVRIDGGLMPGPDSSRRCEYVTIRDLEVFCTEWLVPLYDNGNLPVARGGLLCYYGLGNKYINLIIHNVWQGMSNWVNDADVEVYGCSIYACGWNAPDRSHGHAIYTQNQNPTKTISNNFLTTLYGDGGQLSLQAYGSGISYTDYYTVDHNVASLGYLLIGGDRVSTGNHVVGNIAYGTSIWCGYYLSRYNLVYEVKDNLVINENLYIQKVRTLDEANNSAVNGTVIIYYEDGTRATHSTPRPSQPSVYLFPNKYDPRRANLTILNWNGSSPVLVNFQGVVPPGASFRLMNPKDFYGPAVFQGTADANGMATVPTPSEFNTYIVMPIVQMVNTRPQVNAGMDQSITLPAATITVTGTVSDDGLPAGAAVSRSWSQVSGPGTVVFANASALSTSVSLPAIEGVYVLRLTASDTALSNSDDVSIYVKAQGAVMAMHLPLDEGAGTLAGDLSGGGHNGLLVAGPTWTTGRFGTAMNFNGTSNYVQVNDFNIGSELSVAFWFKPAPGSLGPTAGGYHYIFSWGPVGGANDINVWFTTATESDMGTAIRTSMLDTNDTNTAYVDLKEPANVTFTDGAWHHYCLTVSPVTGRTIYIDANAKHNDHANGGDAFNPATNIILGGRSDLSNERYYAGGMDDVRIYEMALTGSQVLELYTGAPAPTPAADFNGDGKVNGADFLIWQAHYPTTQGADRSMGDTNNDGKVNGQDFLIWQAEYQPM